MITGIASRPWLIVPVCSAMHVTYAICYLIDDKVGLITALHLSTQIFGESAWILFLVVGLMALVPMLAPMSAIAVHLFLWPQQLMLFLMALSAIDAVLVESYPDGYMAPSVFILADQSYAIFLMLGHLAATVRNSRFR